MFCLEQHDEIRWKERADDEKATDDHSMCCGRVDLDAADGSGDAVSLNFYYRSFGNDFDGSAFLFPFLCVFRIFGRTSPAAVSFPFHFGLSYYYCLGINVR